MDIRLKEIPFELNGKTYKLRCNFNVLADIQEEYGGLTEVLNPKKAMRATRILLACMLNDSADENGWSERFTPTSIGRELTFEEFNEISPKLFELVYAAIASQNEEDSKN